MTSGVEGRVVDRFGRVVFFADLAIGEIDEGIGFVVGNEVGPAEESGLAGLVDFVMPTRATGAVLSRVGSNVAPVEVAGLWIDGKLPRVAASHDVDFRFGSWGTQREEVAVGNGIGCVGIDFDADDAAAKVVRIGGGFFGVPGFASRAAINGGIGSGVAKGMGVVTSGGVEAAVGSELKHAAVVATLATLNAPLEDFLFIGKLVALEREAADALAHEIGG